MEELGIYIHIPFCRKKCNYCDFISFQNKEEYIEKYVDALLKEIKIKEIDKEKYIVTSIYIGGGTPSFIDEELIKKILDLIRLKYNVNKTAEITIEVNPNNDIQKKLKKYYEIGINRLSIGLQSTNDKLLEVLGRKRII